MYLGRNIKWNQSKLNCGQLMANYYRCISSLWWDIIVHSIVNNITWHFICQNSLCVIFYTAQRSSGMTNSNWQGYTLMAQEPNPFLAHACRWSHLSFLVFSQFTHLLAWWCLQIGTQIFLSKKQKHIVCMLATACIKQYTH